jgi:AAA-like domain
VKPPARAVVGQLIWSTDGGVWALWRVRPFAHAHTNVADKLAVHARLRGLLLGLPPESMFLSVCERLDPWDVAADMLEGTDGDQHPAWQEICKTSAERLAGRPLHRRRYYLATALPRSRHGWRDLIRQAGVEVSSSFGMAPPAISARELEARHRQARMIEARLERHVPLTRVTAGETRWLYARALQRDIDEPAFDASWEPPRRNDGRAGVLAHLTHARVKEGGDRDDPGRPRFRRYVRIDAPAGTAYQAALALGDMPHEFVFPGGGGEWLYHADELDFPIDWAMRIRSIPNAEAQTKVRRKHRDLVGQEDEYGGDISGAPPQLADAVGAIRDEAAELAANARDPELQVTVLFSIAARTLAVLEERASAVTAMFEPQEYGVARPTGGQQALIRSMLPGTTAALVCRDYTQFLLPGDLAAGAPFCGPDVGDPQGLLLGLSLDTGSPAPVLFDPAYGPQVNKSPSLGACGRLGSGKSFLFKRLAWDTVARGGQVFTIDRTAVGEYVRFGKTVPGRVQVVHLEPGADVCVDPLRTFTGEDRVTVTTGFLSLLAGCSAQSEEGAALAEAIDTVAARPAACLGDVVDELARMGQGDPVARGLARRLALYRRRGVGQLAFGEGRPMSLDADFIVFWAPHLALPDRETLQSEHRSRLMLPEEVLGQALLYLVAAVGRQVVFRDPSRFGAALYDEAWALLASPHGQKLVVEGSRDGRKHNGGIWLGSQHPNDFAIPELEDLLGARFLFDQAHGAIEAALRFLGVNGSVDAANTLEEGLAEGQCLYHDVRGRIGLIQVLEPAPPELKAAFDTTPSAATSAPATAAEVVTPADAGSMAHSVPAGDAENAGLSPRPEEDAFSPTVAARPPLQRAAGHSSGAERQAAASAARNRARRRRRTPLATALADGNGRS